MSKYLSEEEFTQYIELIKKISIQCDNLIKCGIDINSDLMENLFKLEEYNVSYLEKLMHDKYQTISWFIYENDFGDKKFTISQDKPKKEFIIDSVKAIYDYLIHENK